VFDCGLQKNQIPIQASVGIRKRIGPRISKIQNLEGGEFQFSLSQKAPRQRAILLESEADAA
jgi:hypothetical protein